MEETTRSILDLSPNPSAVLSSDGTVVYANPVFLALCGVPASGLAGKRFSDLAHPGDAVMKDLPPSPAEWPSLFEARLSARDGAERFLEMCVSSIDGEFLAQMKDLTELRITEKALEMALEDSETRIHEVAENLDQAVWLMDAETRKYLCRNPAFFRITGLSSDDSANTSWLPQQTVYPDDREAVQAIASRPLSGKLEAEFRIVRPADGDVRWLRSRAFPIFDRKGRLVRIAGITEDITSRKHAEQLREDVERITRHDLKSPLSSIIGVPSFMLERGDVPEEQKEWWRSVHDAGRRMLRMINSSLNLYKMEVGTFQLQPVEVNLAAAAAEAGKDLAGVLSAFAVKLEIANDGCCFPVIAGDGLLVYELLANLIKNAAEASPREGRVTVSFACGNGRVSASIHNAGAIPADIRAKFFQKYVTSGKVHGTGLGAYSARLITATLGGHISFETSDEAGTTIKLDFPDFSAYCAAMEGKQ